MSEEPDLEKIPAHYTGGVLSKVRNASHYSHRCCVPECPSKDNVKGISFHRLPKIKKINKLWKIKCRLLDNIPSTYAVCSKHFLDADYFAGDYRHKKVLLKTAVPSQNLPAASYSRRKNAAQNENRAQRLLNRSAKNTTTGDGAVVKKPSVTKPTKPSVKKKVCVKSPIQNFAFVKTEPISPSATSIEEKPDDKRNIVKVSTVDNALPRVNVMEFLKTRSKLNAWTGLQTFFLLHKIEERVSVIHPKMIGGNELPLLECILLCFIRLKTKLPFICLTSIFHVSTSSASKIFHFMLPFIKKALDDVDYFSSTIESSDNQLIPLRMYGYNEARAIVDCTEGDVQNSQCGSCSTNVDNTSAMQSRSHITKPS